jgi:hypothetical protein
MTQMYFRTIYQSMWALLIVTASLEAQTLIDLSTQTKNVDFSGAVSTKPVALVSVLPSTCSVGQIVFLKTAPAGQNLYFCTAANTWSTQGGVGGPSGGNFNQGFGILFVASQSLTYVTIDTSVILSRASAQASISNFCQSTTGSTAYACFLSPTLLTYTGPTSNPPGSTCLVLYVDTANVSSATVNVDTLGPVPILERSGGALTAGDVPARQPVMACYNGSAFIIQK